jgi:N6-L-threonylcarbamoyladenine synthase
MALLAFETSCDETSVAVVQQSRVLSNVISSQVKLHAEYGGVVPELAARAHLENLLPVATKALHEAKISTDQLSAVAATQGPGLPGALMMGLQAAQTMAYVLRLPFVGVHHHEAHLYSPWTKGAPITADFDAFQPNVALIVSGGHTMLVKVRAKLEHQLLGATLDDAAGECFDKIGKLIGLTYPAGPEIDRLAEQGNPQAYQFPRPLMLEPEDDFSFSGLKTAVRYFLRDRPGFVTNEQQVRDLCASVQQAIVDVLVTKTMRAARREGVPCVTASGGVTCNSKLRAFLAAACKNENLLFRVAERSLCTDNAAMIGLLAELKLQHKQESNLDCDIRPDWGLQETMDVLKNDELRMPK